MNPFQSFELAFDEYNPKAVLLMFSGGHDSLVSTHWAATFLDLKGIPYKVYHGDTGTGIPETRKFVDSVCEFFGWDLVVRSPKPPYDYETLVKKHGFPGPAQHPIMYRNLKEKPLRKYISQEIKSSPQARENVLLVTGIRSSESVIRMGYKESVRKDGSRIWCSPIMDWSEKDCEGWIKAHNLPRNPVKDKICISGECLCGCFAKPEEPSEIKKMFPKAWERIEALSPHSAWRWGSGGRSRYEKHNPPGTMKIPFQPMCVGCNGRD